MRAKLARLLDWVSLAIIVPCVAMVFLIDPISMAYIQPFQPWLLPIILVLSVARLILLPRSAEPERRLPEPSAAWSGATVILVTGVAACWYFGRQGYAAYGLPGLGLPLVIAVLTLAAAFAVFRFASAHKGEIGEARFDANTRP